MKLVAANTLVDYPRLEKIINYVNSTNSLPGDIAEVGVYKGGTARLITQSTGKKVFLFDTFDGMPDVSDKDLHHKGDFADTSISHVDSLLTGHYALYKGIFPRQNAEYVEFRKFSFVHLDVDIYDSVKECLEFFVPRMVKGGVILLDDYLEPNCPGAKLATDEFCAKYNLIVTPTVQSQAVIQL